MEGLNAGVTESEGCCGDAGLCQVLNHCLLSEWANSDVAAVGTQDGWGDPWKVPEAPVEGPEWKKRLVSACPERPGEGPMVTGVVNRVDGSVGEDEAQVRFALGNASARLDVCA